MRLKWLIASGLLFGTMVGPFASAQTANSWYPGPTTLYHVRSCWYDLRSFNGGLARIGMEFDENGASMFYYFSPTDAVQLQKASAIYASLLSAQASGANVYVWVTGTDPVNTVFWDFISVQVGPN
jgi:hypothetical protein